MTALILVLAANTAFNGFPVLGSILAQDRYLPRQLHTRGDRLAFSNGILFLAAFAVVLVVGFQAEVDAPDPALHRRRVRLVHAVADRHGPALEPAAAHRERPGRPAPDAPRAGDQRLRRVHDRGRAGHRAGHQVPARRLDRDRGHGGVLRGDAGHPAALRPGRRRAGGRRGRRRAARRATTRSCWSPSCTARRCARWPTPGRPGRTCWRRSPSTSTTPTPSGLPGEWEDAADPGAAEGDRLAVPGDHPAGARVREAGAHGVARATSSPCSSPSTSSATGGSSCCTTRARLRLKGRLLFQPGVMVTSVPWQLAVLRADRDATPGDPARLDPPRLRGRPLEVRAPAAKS